VPLLCEALAEQDLSVRLVTGLSAPTPSDAILRPADPVSTVVARGKGPLDRMLRSPRAFYLVLTEQVERERPAVVHDHGMWLPTNAVSAWVAHQSDIPFIISTRGMLTSWSLRHHRWKKRLAWWGYQKHVFEKATAFHVTSDEETEALRSLGLHQPAALIPNGVPLPSLQGDIESPEPMRRALFLSRVHPKKGLPMLLEAWANVEPEGWELVIVGPSENGHRAELEENVRRLQLHDDVRFAGPVPDAEKWDEYRQADLFVLPTHSENFGIVVAEALAAKCPVITTTGAPWEDLKTHGCGWWTEPTVPSLTEALRDALGRSDAERRRMGERGRAVVEEKYSWPGVAGEMKRVYRWMVEGGERPSSVRVSA